MNSKLLLELKKQLFHSREDLFNLVNKSNKEFAEREVGDSIDIASESAEKELMFELTDHERVMLYEIDNALKKIQHGTYGICEECEAEIFEARLKVMPAARFCIDCQNKFEKKK
ncbi:TraR/DksA family transcriptional regulator [bacterium]